MRQTLIDRDLAGVMPIVRASGLLSSLCTITSPPDLVDGEDAIGPSGAPIKSQDYIPVEGLIDIPCTAPPTMAADRVQLTEILSLTKIESEDSRHVLLDGYYPQIDERYRALIDGIEFDIRNVEHDSQKIMTRLAVTRVSI